MSHQSKIVNSVTSINVIEVVYRKGTGTEGDPYRFVTQYWSTEGELLVEKDPNH